MRLAPSGFFAFCFLVFVWPLVVWFLLSAWALAPCFVPPTLPSLLGLGTFLLIYILFIFWFGFFLGPTSPPPGRSGGASLILRMRPMLCIRPHSV